MSITKHDEVEAVNIELSAPNKHSDVDIYDLDSKFYEVINPESFKDTEIKAENIKKRKYTITMSVSPASLSSYGTAYIYKDGVAYTSLEYEPSASSQTYEIRYVQSRTEYKLGSWSYSGGVGVSISGNTIAATDTLYEAAEGSKLTFTKVDNADKYTVKEAVYDGTTNEIEVNWDSTNSKYVISAASALKSYTNLTDKPTLDGTSLSGTLTKAGLGIQSTLTAGSGITISDGTISANLDYTNMTNTPTINGNPVTGDLTTESLGILSGANVSISTVQGSTVIAATDTTYTAGNGISISANTNAINVKAPTVRLIKEVSIAQADAINTLVLDQDADANAFALSKIFWVGQLTTDKNCKITLSPSGTSNEFVYMSDYVNGTAALEGTSEIYNLFGFTSAFKTVDTSGYDFLSAEHTSSNFSNIVIGCDVEDAKFYGTIKFYGIDYLG